jgi:hypothetical protein
MAFSEALRLPKEATIYLISMGAIRNISMLWAACFIAQQEDVVIRHTRGRL